MKKLSALLLAVFTAILCCTSCSSSANNKPAGSSETAAPDTVTEEDASEDNTADEETTEDPEETTDTTTTEAVTTTAATTTKTVTTEGTTDEPREGAAPFGDFYDTGYRGDYTFDSSDSDTITFTAGSGSYSFNYGQNYSDEKRIRLAEFFNRCEWNETNASGDISPWLSTDQYVQFMAKRSDVIDFISLRKDSSSLVYVHSAYETDPASDTSIKLISPEISRYTIDYDYITSNISNILGTSMAVSEDNFSILDDSDLYFNLSPYYHPENMTLFPEDSGDSFGSFEIPNYGAFKVEKNTAEVIKILNNRRYSKITNESEIPSQKTGADIVKNYRLGGNPKITAKSDRTYDHVIIMCYSSRGYYIINIVSGKDTVVSCANYIFRTEGDKKICINMDEVKSGHHIEWYRCDGDLAGEIRNAIEKK